MRLARTIRGTFRVVDERLGFTLSTVGVVCSMDGRAVVLVGNGCVATRLLVGRDVRTK